jgi:hypothetical protein
MLDGKLSFELQPSNSPHTGLLNFFLSFLSLNVFRLCCLARSCLSCNRVTAKMGFSFRSGHATDYQALRHEAKVIGGDLTPEGYLPPRNFIFTQRSTAKRAIKQTLMLIGFVLLSLAGLMFPLSVITIIIPFPKDRRRIDDNCRDNSFLTPDSLISRQLTFTEARLIDLGWNIIIGRGLQALVIYHSLCVARASLQRITEQVPVTYDFFAAASLFPTNILALPTLFGGIFVNNGWRPRLISFWLFASCAFVLILPTLVDAMTGYSQAQQLMVPIDGVLVPSVDIKRVSTPGFTPVRNETGAYASIAYIRGTQTCTPLLSAYTWGYSSALFGVCFSMLMIWGFCTWGLWLDAEHNCQQRRVGRWMNDISAANDLSQAIRSELGPHVSAYTGKEMETELRKRLPIMYTAETGDDGVVRLQLSSKRGPPLKLTHDQMYG